MTTAAINKTTPIFHPDVTTKTLEPLLQSSPPPLDSFERGTARFDPENQSKTAVKGGPDRRSIEEVSADKRVAHADGDDDSRVVTLKNGRQFIQEDGLVRSIREKGQKDKDAALLDYDDRGRVILYDKSDVRYERSGSEWIKYDSKNPGGTPWQGEITVDHETGSVKVKPEKSSSKGPDKRTKDEILSFDSSVTDVGEGDPHTSGDRCLHFKDGHSIMQDSKGRATKIDYPNEESIALGYDEKSGDLTSIQHPDGAVWRRDPGSATWSNGKGDVWTGTVAIDHRSGELSWREHGSGLRETITTTGARNFTIEIDVRP